VDESFQWWKKRERNLKEGGKEKVPPGRKPQRPSILRQEKKVTPRWNVKSSLYQPESIGRREET